jgi:hypothetical protein
LELIMGLVEFVSHSFNYCIKGIDQLVDKGAKPAPAAKKVLQLVCKIFAAIDLHYTGKMRDPEYDPDMIKAFKGTIDLIEFYGSYKDLMYWINPFSKNSLDQDSLKQSIIDSLSLSHLNSTDSEIQKACAEVIFQRVMAAEKDYHSKGEVLDAIRISLQDNGYQDPAQISGLAERIIVKQKTRPITQSLYMACFTIADLGGNILTLQSWKMLDLSRLAATIGSQSRVFAFVIELGAKTVLGTIATAGLVLIVGDAIYRAIIHGSELYHAIDPDGKKKAYQEVRNALLDVLSGGVDLMTLSASLLFVLNPPVLVGLAIFAKGTGLICTLVR